jgi:pantoate--beta-alanine ligase
MKIARGITEIRTALETVQRDHEVGLVPTMGALHSGHLALFEAARAECDVVVVSIFVNPAQFGPAEDFDAYPRDEERDLRLAAEAGIDVVFVPSADEMYPEGFQTWVEVEQLAEGFEGAARAGHFRGVATVCLKLFNIVRPHRAYFGQKDAQQAAVVKQVVRDLNVAVQIRVVPTVRDDDGLAVSSRNTYLSAAERKTALALPRALFAGEEAHRRGDNPVTAARAVLAQEPNLDAEYVELAHFNGSLYLLGAARVGQTRLIDNVLLEGALQ